MKWHEIKTLGGYQADEVISALQKEIRRGRPFEAAYWAYELCDTKLDNKEKNLEKKCWQRLLVTSVEDIGPALPKASLITYATYKDIKEGRIFIDNFKDEAPQVYGRPNENEIRNFPKRDTHPILRFSLFNSSENVRSIKEVKKEYDSINRKIQEKLEIEIEKASTPVFGIIDRLIDEEGIKKRLYLDNFAVCGLAYLLAKFPKDRSIDEIYNLAKWSLEDLKEKQYVNYCFKGDRSEYIQALLFSEDESGDRRYWDPRVFEDILYFLQNHEEEFWPTIDEILESRPIKEFGDFKAFENTYRNIARYPFFTALKKTYFLMPKRSGDRYMRGIFAIYSILYPEIFNQQKINFDVPFYDIKEFIEKEHLNIPDYALDKHTKRGKEMGRDDLHFWTEGCKIENISPFRKNEYYNAVLDRIKNKK